MLKISIEKLPNSLTDEEMLETKKINSLSWGAIQNAWEKGSLSSFECKSGRLNFRGRPQIT